MPNLVIRRRADRKPGYRGPLLGYPVPGGTPPVPPVIGLSNYVTEDGTSAYVTEDGSATYTVES